MYGEFVGEVVVWIFDIEVVDGFMCFVDCLFFDWYCKVVVVVVGLFWFVVVFGLLYLVDVFVNDVVVYDYIRVVWLV